ncbi:MAG: DUF2784 domain-containing protein [Deltaproteobacteria bacterium]|nr:DUF2784 domain-containing protein [Deltaproteobacteria bacterium]
MNYTLLADIVLLIHFLFILFIIFGGLLTFKWKKAACFHLPLLLWGILIEYFHWICPLTPLENRLRAMAGETGYNRSFIEHYLLPVIYPGELTREIQLLLGTALLLVNISIYFLIWLKWNKNKRRRLGVDS